MLKASLAGNNGDMYKGNIMLNLVTMIMVHADECELQDDPMYDGPL